MSIKILAIDIETTPSLVWTWGLRDQNVGLSQVVAPTRVLCFAAKWVGRRSKVHFHANWDGSEERQYAMVEAAHELLSEADAVLHYNGASFDEKHLNREFLEHGFAPPEPFQTIDLIRAVRGNFRFLSNKLDHVTQQLDLEGKIQHEGFSLWTRCMDGDASAQARMTRYNKRDVTLLEDLYRAVLPWIKGHPNVNQFHDGPEGCPKCGSREFHKRGLKRTSVSVWQQYQCNECRGYFRAGKRAKGYDKR